VGRNDAGRTLTQAVGGQPIAFDRPRGGAVTVLGYPAAPPFTGERLTYCAGALRQDTVGLSSDQGLRCDMTPGSSGGPWLAGFDPVLGRGTLVSVTSFMYTAHTGYLWGPYLGATARSLFTAVSTTTTA
jgi:V8-like Glu-specific endopeptidase